MKKLFIALVACSISSMASADVICKGKITKVHKWNNEERISIIMDTANSWIQMPTQADDAMALMAFAADKTIEVSWKDPAITSCTNGWAHHTQLKGWWWVLKNDT
ncbi:conserved exported hypothetical protein [Vibrio nigripulchritudo SOn1]|uniref:Uncharacterized protein n=1 Tax=Vibrio nigripulchritudo SOn1 TaxID=1238450 RepID=A0AAV2VYB2_9VIBR|nr:hypothetical protein [Vibrio nigripulchritudo]CCO49713.1 conserved exported hypothetical protein [Vibrio nigripulchritudo SOn1]